MVFGKMIIKLKTMVTKLYNYKKEAMLMEIGNVIREYRSLKGMTQEELAQALSVTPQAVSRWELGVSYPDIAMVPAIVKVLGVSADELLGCGNSDKEGDASTASDYRSKQGSEGDVLNQSQIDSIFDYVPLEGGESKMVLVVDASPLFICHASRHIRVLPE